MPCSAANEVGFVLREIVRRRGCLRGGGASGRTDIMGAPILRELAQQVGVLWRKLPARKWVVGGAGLLAALAIWHAMTSEPSARNQRRVTAAPVRVAAVTRRDMAVVEHSLGKVVANTLVQVTPRVQGVLDSAHFKEGQFVKKGELLF